jgi:hypothetical protein
MDVEHRCLDTVRDFLPRPQASSYWPIFCSQAAVFPSDHRRSGYVRTHVTCQLYVMLLIVNLKVIQLHFVYDIQTTM